MICLVEEPQGVSKGSIGEHVEAKSYTLKKTKKNIDAPVLHVSLDLC